jgi:pimeloyl-ACP methyl ester carboxylesterase
MEFLSAAIGIMIWRRSMPLTLADAFLLGDGSCARPPHRHTADIHRPLTFEQMADDSAALLKHLKIEQADIFGYSMGSSTRKEVGNSSEED